MAEPERPAAEPAARRSLASRHTVPPALGALAPPGEPVRALVERALGGDAGASSGGWS